MSITNITVIALIVIAALLLVGLAMAVKIVKQYEQGVLLRRGKAQPVEASRMRLTPPASHPSTAGKPGPPRGRCQP